MPSDGEISSMRSALMLRHRRRADRPMVGMIESLGAHIDRLEPYSGALRERYSAYKKALDFIDTHEGGLDRFTQGHKKMGFQIDDKGGVTYREWAAGAVEARLIGDFSKRPVHFSDADSKDNWSHTANPMTKNEFGVWECYVPPTADGKCAIPHDSMVKISMTTPSGESIDRIPAWITRVTQDLKVSPVYDARFWNPPAQERYKFKHGHSTNSIEGLKIYEAHGELRRLLRYLTSSSRNLQSGETRNHVQGVRKGRSTPHQSSRIQHHPDVSAGSQRYELTSGWPSWSMPITLVRLKIQGPN